MGETLESKQEWVFEHLYESFQFGGMIAESGRPDRETTPAGGAVWSRKLVVEVDGEERKVVFKVRFMKGGSIPVEAYALDIASGGEIGSL